MNAHKYWNPKTEFMPREDLEKLQLINLKN